jgi:hypothetical protein
VGKSKEQEQGRVGDWEIMRPETWRGPVFH